MATFVEKSRKVSSRAIYRIVELPYFGFPPKENNIYINVIDEITFVDRTDQSQETTFTFDHSDTSSRVAHVIGFGKRPFYFTNAITDAEIVGPLGVDGNTRFQFEVVEKVRVLDKRERAQEYWYTFRDDGTPQPHLKTHTKTICNKNPFSGDLAGFAGSGTMIAIQRVDQISFIDPRKQYQETIYQLNWGDHEDDDDAHPADPDNTWNDTTINPPFRLDPFQTVVGVNDASRLVRSDFIGHCTCWDNPGADGSCDDQSGSVITNLGDPGTEDFITDGNSFIVSTDPITLLDVPDGNKVPLGGYSGYGSGHTISAYYMTIYGVSLRGQSPDTGTIPCTQITLFHNYHHGPQVFTQYNVVYRYPSPPPP